MLWFVPQQISRSPKSAANRSKYVGKLGEFCSAGAPLAIGVTCDPEPVPFRGEISVREILGETSEKILPINQQWRRPSSSSSRRCCCRRGCRNRSSRKSGLPLSKSKPSRLVPGAFWISVVNLWKQLPDSRD